MYNKQNDFKSKYPNISVDNFRDLGGIEVSGGRVIRDGMIFRSGELYNLGDTDKTELDKLNIDCIFDLRGTDEEEYKPDYVPKNAVYYNIPAAKTKKSLVVNPDIVADMVPKHLPASVSIWAFKARFMHLYRKFPFGNKAYAKIFEAMDEGKRFLFHCTAGKDRTGVASMLILLALGADLETVKNDYMLSNYYRAENIAAYNKRFECFPHHEKLKKVMEVSGRVDMCYFDAAYGKIIGRYGNVSQFFKKEYNVDEKRIEAWLRHYTLPVLE